MTETPNSNSVSTKLQRIAELARQMPGVALKTLAHHIDIELLREAYRRTRKDGAAGVDEVTAEEYAARLDENLTDVLERFKSGRYVAPAVRRVHIPKGDGTKTRPIGIPTFEDKVLQRAVTMVLSAVYERDFRACSYGFRPSRSAHQALDALREELMQMRGGWVLEVDIERFFDTLDHGHLRQMLDQRVRDGVLRRSIDKWLKAGVLEGDELRYPEEGTPQGGVISPLLANIYLHNVLDTWFEEVVRPRMKAKAFMVRYADDFVIVFARKDDALRVFDVLPKRFGKYGLKLHPEKTRLVPFVRPVLSWKPKGRRDGPGSFDLLGFTFCWSRSLRGHWVIKMKTAKSRLNRALKRIEEWCRWNRHLSVREQHKALVVRVRGHYNYFGVTANWLSLAGYITGVRRAWRKWLNRRSQRARMSWVKFNQLAERYPLPEPVLSRRYATSAAKP